jgi:hypothetical protein
MDILALSQWIKDNSLLISLTSIGISLFILIYFLIANARLNKYRQLLKGSQGKDLEAVLLNYAETTQIVYNKINKFEEKFLANQVLEEKHLQKIGLVRFKAFQNSGGDQSFALALLDGSGDGVVISSIFGRDEARVYCKPVQQGSSNYPISDEEKESIEKALGFFKR